MSGEDSAKLSNEGVQGEAEAETDRHHIPHNRMWIVLPAILIIIFFPALDQTITSVALPTIIGELGGQSGYSWVGTAYLLASASLAPLYGKLSDVFGRKPVYMTTMFLFMLGSALCGGAQSFVWLAIARGIQGAGGGGLIQLSMITLSDITPLNKRGMYIGAVGIVWGVASVIGPTIGGVLTDHASWRWCFWINLPVGGVSSPLLLRFLKLNAVPKKPFRQLAGEFDFSGLFLVMAGVSCLIVGVDNGQRDWSAMRTIFLVVIGGVLIIAFAVNECRITRNPLIPPKLFQMRTPATVLISAFIHGMAIFAGSYYIPVYFEVLGSSATLAGVKAMAYSLVSSISGAVVGILMNWTGYRPILWASWTLMTIGYGLMIQLDSTTSVALQEVYIIIAGIGIGGLFQTPLVALHAAMPVKYMATSTSVLMLLRLLGAALGISLGNTILGSELKKRLSSIPNYHPSTGTQLTNDLRGLNDIEPAATRRAVLHAYSRSFSTIWLFLTPMIFVGFLLSLMVRLHTLDRPTTTGECEQENIALGAKEDPGGNSESRV